MRALAQVFKALSEETRLQMMALLLQRGELCVCDLMQVLEITQSKASRHLRYLANAGLLVDRREGLWVYYRVAETLDAERAAVVALVRELLAPERVEELISRLSEWVETKDAVTTCCPPD
jgi:ArsR family transcriptional regulator, arsenate/arsenite/antimonite-responsive transcriptional repressor